jgi:hypothetical protein
VPRENYVIYYGFLRRRNADPAKVDSWTERELVDQVFTLFEAEEHARVLAELARSRSKSGGIDIFKTHILLATPDGTRCWYWELSLSD